MSPVKRRKLLLFTTHFLVKLMHWSYRYRVIHPERHTKAESIHPCQSIAIASWHQNCLAGIMAHANRGYTLLVSKSFDGDLISHAASKIGINSIRGSSSRGGKDALRILIDKTHQGLRSAFTVDGPKGPAYSVKRGILQLAAETGTPILPLLTIGERYWTLHKSWDQFRVPKPFSKVYVIYGEPFLVTKEMYETSIEGCKADLQERLHQLEADIPQRAAKAKLRLKEERERLTSLASARST